MARIFRAPCSCFGVCRLLISHAFHGREIRKTFPRLLSEGRKSLVKLRSSPSILTCSSLKLSCWRPKALTQISLFLKQLKLFLFRKQSSLRFEIKENFPKALFSSIQPEFNFRFLLFSRSHLAILFFCTVNECVFKQ